MPFEKAVGFDLEIHNEPYAFAVSYFSNQMQTPKSCSFPYYPIFQVTVNGERFASYAHRLSPDEVNGLQIGGDVEITGIQLA